MKRLLIKTKKYKLYHVVNGAEIEGKNPNMSGDCSGLWGDCSELCGDCSGLRGDCSELRGDLGDCDISDDERKSGIYITDLIEVKK